MSAKESRTPSKPQFTAKELGRMTYEELRKIAHCWNCLESYERCQCQTGRERRRKESR